MARLSTLIADMQERFTAQHGHEDAQLRALADQIRKQGNAIEDQLDDILETYHGHRAEVASKLVTLARALGLVPEVASAPAKPVSAAQTAAIDAAIDGVLPEAGSRGAPEAGIRGADVSTAIPAIENHPRMPRFMQGMGPQAHLKGASDAHFASAPGSGQH